MSFHYKTRSLNSAYTFLETLTNAIECRFVISFHNKHRHVSATHIVILSGDNNKNTITIILYSFSYHPAVVRPNVL
jgi:hypothetical protein